MRGQRPGWEPGRVRGSTRPRTGWGGAGRLCHRWGAPQARQARRSRGPGRGSRRGPPGGRGRPVVPALCRSTRFNAVRNLLLVRLRKRRQRGKSP